MDTINVEFLELELIEVRNEKEEVNNTTNWYFI